MKRRRFLSLLLAIIFCLGQLPVTVQAAAAADITVTELVPCKYTV